ncbi:hypothetical protein RKS58_07820 [Lysinibacillus capsici]|uniref:hypothetical protein n=1 Tax=Lysinibacillus capsici TaxID=2115968 RepID=UPI0028BF1EA7|nr:hypothetical protein [Lysinibacillus capsici]WNN77737.1 hypothetical protein RKS58_07820 [Lysinibacillus capsici]
MMIPNQVNESTLVKSLFEMAGITEEFVIQKLDDFIREHARRKLLFWDLEEMTQYIPFCEKTIEEKIIKQDPRWRQYQRRSGPNGKRIWLYEPTSKFMVDYIMKNWDI